MKKIFTVVLEQKSIISILTLLLSLFWGIREAKADLDYPFVKVDCNKNTQAVTASVTHIYNGDGQKMIAAIKGHKVKNIYYLIDIAKEPKKKIKCDLGNKQVVSFIAWHNGDHMAGDSLEIALHDINIGSIPFSAGSYQASIKAFGSSEAKIRVCPLQKFTDKVEENDCKVQHFRNGKPVTGDRQ